MLVYKILQQFFILDVFIFLIFTIGTIFLFKKKQGPGRFFILAALILYYFFSITPIADLITFSLEDRYAALSGSKEELTGADIIVVLSGGNESSIIRASEALRIYNLSKNYAIESEFQKTIIVSGTHPLHKEINEPERIKTFLVECGVDINDIILEDKSRTTFENVQRTKDLVGEKPFFLVTSGLHMPRAVETFKGVGANPIPVPAKFKVKKDYNLLDFFPAAGNVSRAGSALREHLGMLFYKFK